MNLPKSLLAASVTLAFSALAPSATPQSLPARTAAISGLTLVNDPAAPGWMQRASLMMADENYRGAADQLRFILPTLPEGPEREATEFMLARTAAHLPGEDAAGIFSTFLEKYPASVYRLEALAGLADVLFDTEDYAAALAIYRSIDRGALNPSVAESVALRLAYCEIKFGNYEAAQDVLHPLLSTPAANDARFYRAYIEYTQGKLPLALETFKAVKNTGTSPTNATPYYLAQLYYHNGDYAQALSSARSLLAAGCPAEYKAETARIAGESLYELGDRNAAIPFLNQYMAARQADEAATHPNVVYILGEDAYDKGDYSKAIEWFSLATQQDDIRAQRALLLIGQSYMHKQNYDAALLSLDRAAKISLDPSLTESAAYNYAVASSRGGRLPFASSIAQFEEFVKKYPDSKMAPAVNDYIINGYISDNNYGAALAAINRISRPSDKVLAAKQQVLYLHGARQLQAGRTEDAIKLLTEARSLGRYSGETASEATLWLGEANYKKGNYQEAVKNYATFLNETPSTNPNHALALYDMAYGQFALKDFSKAADYFSKYLKAAGKAEPAVADSSLQADAYNRLGDAYYYQTNLSSAAGNYQKAIDTAPEAADYPMYQLAVIRGLQRDHQGKIAGLGALLEQFPASALVPSALLETAESYNELGDSQKAMKTYSIVADRFPSTSQGRQGALLLAIAELNAGQEEKAIESYRYVVTKYPTSEEARAAAEDLKHIYADRGDIASYTAFMASVPDAPKMDQTELIALQLEAVEKAYEAGRDNDAIRQAEELVRTFPDSPQAVEALGILGDLRRQQGHPAEALEAYRLLAEKSSNEIDVNRARMGILSISRDLGSNEAVLETAAQLLASSSLGSDDRREVMLTKALALGNLGDNAESDKILSELAANPETLPGAKAAYYLAQGQFDRGNITDASKTVNALIDSNTPHEYWLARGFILLSDIKFREGDNYLAEEYLRTLRDNYPGEEADIFSMIQQRLN